MSKKKIITVIVVIFLLIVTAVIFNSLRFKVVDSAPKQGGAIGTTNSIIIDYDRPIDIEKVKVSATPNFAYSTRADGNKLYISPTSEMELAIDYALDIDNVCEAKNKTSCINYRLQFKTGEVDFNSLSPEQQSELTNEVNESFVENPILSILPVQETDFTITQNTIQDQLYIVIEPNVLASGKTEEEYDQQYKDFYAEGVEYIRRNGYETESSKYKLISGQDFNKFETTPSEAGAD